MTNRFQKPTIFSAKNQRKYQHLIATHPEIKIVDEYEDQINELYKIRHPAEQNNQLKKQQFVEQLFGPRPLSTGQWVYFHWKNTLVHILDQSFFEEIRTARNYPLISKSEQKRFNAGVIAIVGLSVGSSIALTIAQSGGGNTMKLADFDTLSLSNLNRIKGSLTNLGQNKTHLVAEQIYELNPYANLILFEAGLNASNLEEFMCADPKPNVIIDEADDLATKQFVRLAARSLKIPLVMATDNGLESNIRIIRFDRSPNASHMKNVPTLSFKQVLSGYQKLEPAKLTTHQKLKLIAKLVGTKNVSYEMQKGSIMAAKNQIAGWPQIAPTVFLGGSLAAYAVLLILNNQSTPASQKTISIIKLLKLQQTQQRTKAIHHRHLKKFIKFIKN